MSSDADVEANPTRVVLSVFGAVALLLAWRAGMVFNLFAIKFRHVTRAGERANEPIAARRNDHLGPGATCVR